MAEKTFFSEGSIVVTTARITIRGDNFFVNQIAGSKIRYTVETDKMKDFLRKLAIVGSIIAGIGVGLAAGSLVLGAILIVAGIIAAVLFIKPKYKLYHLYLGMSSGEQDAFRSRNSAFVNQVNNAINEALASRA